MNPLAIAGLILSVVGTAASAVMQYQAANAAADQAKKNAEYNAKLAAQKAEQARAARMAQANSERDQQRRRRAGLEAQFAASGLLLEGSPSDWLTQQAGVDEMNVLQRSRTGEIFAQGLDTKAAMYIAQGKNQASAYHTQGNAALISGIGNAAGSAASWLSLMPES